MANAGQYHDAAIRYARLGEDLCRQAALLAAWQPESELGSSPAAAMVKERLAWAAADLNWAGREMARLASECRWRAGICDTYRKAVWAWWALPVLSRPMYPAQPYRWVTAL